AAVGDLALRQSARRLARLPEGGDVSAFLAVRLPKLGLDLLQVFPGRRQPPLLLRRTGERHEVARLAVLLAAGERVAGAVEDAVQGVVVLLRDGVVLVVVAAGAADRQAED